jgi:signal transduction histidine kinase
MIKRKSVLFYYLFLLFFCGPAVHAQKAETSFHQAQKLYEQNNYAAAQEKYLEVLKQAEAENNPALRAKASLYLARCHYLLNDRNAALKWSYDALNTIQEYHIDSILSDAYYFLGVLYIEAEKVDSAEKYSLRAVELFKKEKNYARLSQTYSTLSELYMGKLKDTAKIESMIANAEKFAELSQNKAMMAFAASKRYNYAFYMKKDYEEALRHVNEAEKLYLETGNREAILNSFRAKAECLIMLRDTSARTYMMKWFAFKDSVLQAEKALNIAKYETLYETQKKEQENKYLKHEIELNRLIILVIGVVFLFFVALGLWLYNRNNLKKKQHELLLLQKSQEDKERIARDLHDNVGGQLSYIIYSLDGIKDEDKERRSEVADSINQSVRSIIGSLRETIWATTKANIYVQDFSDKLKLFARNLFKYGNTQIYFTEDIQTNRELNSLLGLNLYRICQEILNNAFKHANSTEVRIDLQCEKDKLVIEISDNGIGFDVNQQDKEHYGLENIKKRAEEFGIALNLETEMNKGTKYVLWV